ncbi:MliC family protein [Marinomonas sp. A79]|uniref:MliC family protein n=1 Tax=Marinomonas vulgaris TaxID=2823372 RepID=A0ABS5HA75_9GAMM|nr:MliC family protein [Marinomonas vulgaris]MBR7888274.1 MliC family protein [Marinomonas vulgaris]
MGSYTEQALKRTIERPIAKMLVLGSCLLLSACSVIEKGSPVESIISEEIAEISNLDQTNVAAYSCDGQTLDIHFHSNQAQLSWQGDEYFLTQAVSASGAYFLGEGLSFWVHGDHAVLSFHHANKQACQLIQVNS